MTYTFGIEIETSGVSYPNVQRALRDAGIKGFEAKPDGTPSVDAEIVLPPMADCQIAWEYVADVCRVLDRIGCRVNRSCGLHVHVGMRHCPTKQPPRNTLVQALHTKNGLDVSTLTMARRLM